MYQVDEIVQKIRNHYKDFAGCHDEIPAARKFMFFGTIVEIKGKYEFTANLPGQGHMLCLCLIDAIDPQVYKVGMKVYMICVTEPGENRMKVLYMSPNQDDRVTLMKASIILGCDEKPKSPSAKSVKDNPVTPELEGLSPESRAYIAKCRRTTDKSVHAAKAKKSTKIPVKEIKRVYEMCRDYLPESTRAVVGDLVSRPMTSRTEQRVRVLMSIQTNFEKETVSAEEFRDRMNERVYGMQEVKDVVCETVMASELSDADFTLRILLIGPKGVGKEEMARSIACARGKPYAVIPYGCFSSLPDAGGCSSLYDGSKPGAFAEAFFEEGTTDMTLILSSLDAATGCKEKNGDPSQILQEMLDGKLCDQYLECPIDVSKTWMIGLASSDEDIPVQIVNGFDRIFYIDPLSDTKKERLHITRQFLLPKLQREFGLDPYRTYFTEEQLNYLLHELCYDQGMDRMEGYLRSLLLYMVSHRNKKLTYAVIDRILHKDRILAKPSAIVSGNITFFDKADRKVMRKYIEDSEHASGDRKESAMRIVKAFASMFRNTVSITPFDFKGYMALLDKTHSGLYEPKFAGARMISRQANTTNHNGKNVLFFGPPGTGKTTLLRSCAHAANDLPFAKISCNGVSESSFFKGNSHSFKEANFGKVFNTLCSTGLHALILLDEIDKIGSQDAMASLLDLLDEKRFYDNFAGVSIDVSSVIFCASANDLSRVAQPLLDRFELIELPGYSFDQKAAILREHMLPQTLREHDDPEITFTEEAQTLLVKYCKGTGARDLKTNLQKVVESVLLEHEGEKYTVGVSDLIRYLGPVPYERRMLTELCPGVVHGLAVSDYGGFVTDIMIVRCKEDKLTGLVEGSCRESVEVAKTAAATICPSCEDDHFHLHFGVGDSSSRKDGSSAGLALALGLISCETKTPIDPYCAFTGELSPAGHVCAVGGVCSKIQAAIDAGIKRVMIPRDNYMNLRAQDLEHFTKHLEVIPVDTLEEVYSRVMIPQDKQSVS